MKKENKLFSKNLEDFVCLNCESKVLGDGYTNHCPECLWSSHVDIQPGDRSENCKGSMKPIRVEGMMPGKQKIVHKCQSCGVEKRCKLRETDSIDAIVDIIKGVRS